MATVREALKAHLLADATLMALMSGGVFDAEDLPLDGGSMGDVPLQPDGVRIKPFIVPRWRGARRGEIASTSQYRTLELYFYADTGYSVLEAAQNRVIAILHQQKLLAETDADRYAFFEWVMNRGELPAPELNNAASDMSRFMVGNLRRV